MNSFPSDVRGRFRLVAAPFTPFHADGQIALERIPPLADFLAAARVHGVFVCGTTGEGLSLSSLERQQVTEAWVKAARDRLAVIVHVGHTSIRSAQALAAHAADHGVSGIATIAPIFYRPRHLEDLVHSCAEIASAAPSLPFFYYHIPSMTHCSFSMAEFLQLAAERIPNLAGLKFSHEDLVDYRLACEVQNGRFEVFFGRDEMLLPSLAFGAREAVGATYNFAPQLYQQLIASFSHGDLKAAQSDQSRSIQMISILQRHGFLPAAKTLMRFIGLDCGPVRSPLRNLDPAATALLRRELEALAYFDFKE